ncbi:hypothetical protein PO124_28130 [Bacillus licheniformis]|nr:hypothetical protein [Bacillus licheniformis]
MKDKHVFNICRRLPALRALAGSDMETGELIDYIEAFYQKLNQAGFAKGTICSFSATSSRLCRSRIQISLSPAPSGYTMN